LQPIVGNRTPRRNLENALIEKSAALPRPLLTSTAILRLNQEREIETEIETERERERERERVRESERERE
jgi:hypothetical protein